MYPVQVRGATIVGRAGNELTSGFSKLQTPPTATHATASCKVRFCFPAKQFSMNQPTAASTRGMPVKNPAILAAGGKQKQD